MGNGKQKRLSKTALAAVLFALALLTLTPLLLIAYREELRSYVVQPALEAYFLAKYYLAFVPQALLWSLPFAVVGLATLRGFIRRMSPPSSSTTTWAKGRRPLSPQAAEIAKLDALIGRSNHSRFARVRLSRVLKEIAIRLIAQNEGIPLAKARYRLSEGIWRETSTVHEFLIPRKHYASRIGADEFHRNLLQTIQHLESYDRFGDAAQQLERRFSA